METLRSSRALVLLACSSMAWSGALAQSQTSQGASAPARSTAAANRRIEALQKQLTEQGQQIDELKKLTADQEARFKELQERLEGQEARAQAARPLAAPGSKTSGTEISSARKGPFSAPSVTPA